MSGFDGNVTIKEQQVVTHEQMKMMNDPCSLVYDMDDGPITKEGLPDASKILDDVIRILQCMATEEMILLKKNDVALYENLLEEKFSDFALRYYSVFKMVISGEDITPLFKMLEIIGNVKQGNISIEDGEKNVGSYLTKFLPDGLMEKLASGEVAIDGKVNNKANKGGKMKGRQNKKK